MDCVITPDRERETPNPCTAIVLYVAPADSPPVDDSAAQAKPTVDAPLGEAVPIVVTLEDLQRFFPCKVPEDRWPYIHRQLRLKGERHKQVLRGLAAGMTDNQICQALKLPKGTLRTYLERMFNRTGIRSRTKLAIRVMELAAEATKV